MSPPFPGSKRIRTAVVRLACACVALGRAAPEEEPEQEREEGRGGMERGLSHLKAAAALGVRCVHLQRFHVRSGFIET